MQVTDLGDTMSDLDLNVRADLLDAILRNSVPKQWVTKHIAIFEFGVTGLDYDISKPPIQIHVLFPKDRSLRPEILDYTIPS